MKTNLYEVTVGITPKDFSTMPMNSISKNWESERVATNIMVVLGRTGNTWRELTWDEYLAERIKDGGSNTNSDKHGSEKDIFEKVAPYCTSPSMAKKFCRTWI